MTRRFLTQIIPLTVAFAAMFGVLTAAGEETFSVVSTRPDTSAPREIARVPLADLDASLLRGVDFLLQTQRKDGSWGAPGQTKGLNIYAPGTSHEGYRTGTTALCLESLLLVEKSLQKELPPEKLMEVSAAVDRCELWMFERMSKLRRSAPDVLYNNWGHAYGIQAFKLMYERPVRLPKAERDARRERILNEIRTQVALLGKYECTDGGWVYYDFETPTQHPNYSTFSFMTGTVLVALADARDCGAEVPQKMVDRALKSILRQRFPNGSYAYGEYLAEYGAEGINKPAGSLGRSQVCNLALGLWGDTKYATQENYLEWLDRFVARIGWLDMGRKRPVPHESWNKVAAYFYYFGHYYAVRCIEQLDDPAQQVRLANHQVAILLERQEKNGSWWDFPLYDYHPYYGTAMAVTTLVKCRELLTK